MQTTTPNDKLDEIESFANHILDTDDPEQAAGNATEIRHVASTLKTDPEAAGYDIDLALALLRFHANGLKAGIVAGQETDDLVGIRHALDELLTAVDEELAERDVDVA